jgi:hypothetical protein
MTSSKGFAFRCQTPESASHAEREPGALQPIVCPTRSLLVDGLRAARKHLLALRCVQAQSRRRSFVNVARRCTVSMACEVANSRPIIVDLLREYQI